MEPPRFDLDIWPPLLSVSVRKLAPVRGELRKDSDLREDVYVC